MNASCGLNFVAGLQYEATCLMTILTPAPAAGSKAISGGVYLDIAECGNDTVTAGSHSQDRIGT